MTSVRKEGSVPYWAHSANAHGACHRLADHLASVSKLAREFLQGQKGEEESALGGLLHDLGKYGDLFQARLRGEHKRWITGCSGPLVSVEHSATYIDSAATADLMTFVLPPQYSASIWRLYEQI